MNAYITGDTHGDFFYIRQFCKAMGTSKNDIIIVLGDVCLNYFNDKRDIERRKKASEIQIQQFCIHGNHDMRPEHIDSYELIDWHGGKVWKDPHFPKLLFARDGDIYEISGKQVLVIGGAYSVDKENLQRQGYHWFEDEQPSEEIKQRVKGSLDNVGWKVDTVLSHTCPERYIPQDKLLKEYNKNLVDQSTEEWLGSIERRLDYKEWYCGHFHINRQVDRLTFLYHDIRLF